MARYDRQYGRPPGGWRGGERGPWSGGPPRRGWTGEPGAPRPRDFDPGDYGPEAGYTGWAPYVTPRRGIDDLRGGRGEYGGGYEGYGGYPGGSSRGGAYGGRASQRRGYDAGWGRDAEFARAPFMPDEAYRRHPEYRQQPDRREWEAHQHEYGFEPEDDEVREAVYRRMRADAWVDPARIDVQVEDGVVTLTGEVDDFLTARYAWDDAWETDGVRGVVNQLTVRADQPRANTHGDIVVQTAGDQITPDEASEMG